MPQVTQVKEATPYGVSQSNNTLLFQERLMLLFKPHEYVTVMNVDDEPYIWQYMPASSEEIEITADPMKITHRGDPEVWMIEPGDKETIVGANAYIMIDGLYKKLTAKKKLADNPDTHGQAINFSFSDSEQQQKWINRIYLGKATPTFQSTNVEEDLGLEDAAVTAAKQTLTRPTPAKV